MTDSVFVGDLIALREDIPEHNLTRDRVGAVATVITWQEFEVEFRDAEYQLVTKIPLKREQVRILRHETTLDDRVFWKLIEDANTRSGNSAEQQVELLTATLAERSIADIYAFGLLTKKYMWFAFRSYLWAAAYIIQSGCSDDGFKDFLGWLVGRGEKVYYDALQDPETLIDLIEVNCDYGWAYGEISIGVDFVDYYAYEKKMGEEMRHAPHYPAIPRLIGPSWNEETARQMYPKLTAKFGIGECDED